MSDDLRNTLSIHIDIDQAATRDEADAFFDALGEWVGEWMEANPQRGEWDPFVMSHTDSCEDSDHCHGPGSWVERRIAARALREFADNYVKAQTAGRMAEDLHARADEIAKGD